MNKLVTEPHPENFCGGNFQDWLEINLLPECNAKCSWCVEKFGYHPNHKASWEEIGDAAINTNRTNIILLGGEPLLYKDLSKLIEKLSINKKQVWITTNGSKINSQFVTENLMKISGINISIHHYDLLKNAEITHIILKKDNLINGLELLKNFNIKIRFNCNTIKGYIDNEIEMLSYIKFAKEYGADSVRFAELKIDEKNFIDLAKILNYKYGLNDDPFLMGCWKEVIIDGILVNFRQMCGIQTSCRPMPINPKQYSKQVLYYDGKIYKGWQSSLFRLADEVIDQIVDDVANKKMNKKEAIRLLTTQ